MDRQTEVLALIPFKKTARPGESAPMNAELERIYWLLQKYKYDQHELEILERAILAAIPVRPEKAKKKASNG